MKTDDFYIKRVCKLVAQYNMTKIVKWKKGVKVCYSYNVEFNFTWYT